MLKHSHSIRFATAAPQCRAELLECARFTAAFNTPSLQTFELIHIVFKQKWNNGTLITAFFVTWFLLFHLPSAVQL